MNPAAGTNAATILRLRLEGSPSLAASISNDGMSTSPTARVAVAITPAPAAVRHRPVRAHQNAATLERRNSDSLYGAMKTNEAGNDASNTTERRATFSVYSSVVSPYRKMRARRNATFETRMAAPSAPMGSNHAKARATSG